MGSGRSAETLFKMISENHAAILSAFTVSNKNPAVAVSEIRRLLQSFLDLEAVATKIYNIGESDFLWKLDLMESNSSSL